MRSGESSASSPASESKRPADERKGNMARINPVFAVVMIGVALGLTGCDNSDQIRRDQADIDQHFQQQEKRLHDLDVEYARTTLGPQTAKQLELCFDQGFSPAAPNPGTSAGTLTVTGSSQGTGSSTLSRREAANCNAIIARINKRKAQDEAEEAKKDAEYDKAHPVK